MYYVVCKTCSHHILVASKPKGSTSAQNIHLEGNVSMEGGKIGFGPGGKISFSRGGSIGLGRPILSTLSCPKCSSSHEYSVDEIIEI